MMMEVCDHPFDEKSLAEYVRNATASPFLVKTWWMIRPPTRSYRGTPTARCSLCGRRRNSRGTSFQRCSSTAISPASLGSSTLTVFVRLQQAGGSSAMRCSARARKINLCEIRRRRAWSNKPLNNVQHQTYNPPKLSDHQHQISDEDQRSSSTSSSSEYTSLICENKRLRQENGVLNFELKISKKKCKQLLELVAVCEADAEKEEENYEHEGPMLFGVRLMEVQRGYKKKRKRVEVN